MSVSRKVGILLLAGVIGFAGAELGEQFSVPGVHSLIPTAEAVVGRPDTSERRWCGTTHRAPLRHRRL